jgi:hypothetical protein
MTFPARTRKVAHARARGQEASSVNVRAATTISGSFLRRHTSSMREVIPRHVYPRLGTVLIRVQWTLQSFGPERL